MNLAIAHQILKLGIPLKYKIRFGWFSGEEQGLYGSTFFVNQLNSLQTAQTLALLDYDMIASTNWIPFMYVPNNVTEPTLPQAQKDAEATLSKTHIDYLNNKLNVKQVDYPFDNRSDYAQWRRVGDPRRARDRLLHRRRGIKTAQQVADNAASTAGNGGQSGIQADPCYHEWCDTVFNLSRTAWTSSLTCSRTASSRSPASVRTPSRCRSVRTTKRQPGLPRAKPPAALAVRGIVTGHDRWA